MTGTCHTNSEMGCEKCSDLPFVVVKAIVVAVGVVVVTVAARNKLVVSKTWMESGSKENEVD